ncbi:MAG: alpha/beta fold hydrolase [Xanthomonadaceae bacterium]|jgi:abhydrolase domain-containing protein 6|nr:alpha/beta fold hydrolase [Xanthomonadaceae bacterium]MCZ8318570.1 alpha/beta fold hydrolase [Silanimonas sp.]
MRAARVPTVSSGAPRGLRRRTIILAALAFDVLLVVGLLAWRPEWALQGWFAVQRLQAGASEQVVEADGQRVVQLEAGPVDAPVVVLLHGFTGSKENWLPLMADLARDHRVIAPDLPGWGGSARVAGADYGVVAQSERIAAWLGTLPRPPALLVGHSMGGHITALVAARHPDLVPRLALMSAAGVPFEENAFGRAVLAGGHPFAVEDRASLDRYLGLVFTNPPLVPWPVDRALVARRIADRGFEESVLSRLRGAERFAVQPLLPDIAAPTLLLWCDDDRVIDASAAAMYAAGLRNARTVMLQGCGHMPMLAAVEDVADALRSQATVALPAPSVE